MTRPSSSRIDQLLAGVANGDATSHAAFTLRDALRQLGFASDVYALPEHTDPSIAHACRDARAYDGKRDDILIHHYGMTSPAAELFQASPARKILIYHNITPSSCFRGYDDEVQSSLAASREQLPALAAACQSTWAASEFNAQELRAMGAPDVKVWPLPLVTTPLDQASDAAVRGRLQAPLTTILCVGRIAPNKCIEELIEAYAWYHHSYNPFSRLLIVGSPRSAPKYFTYLRLWAHDLGVPNVCFEGFASPAGLVAYYELADLLVSTSRHEGYCLPLVEAMHKRVPVISRAVGGTPEAMGSGGVQYDELTPRQLAGLMHRVVSDAGLRDTVMQSQAQRVAAEQQRDFAAELSVLLESL